MTTLLELADMLKEVAENGRVLQYSEDDEWHDWPEHRGIFPGSGGYEYRLKPIPKMVYYRIYRLDGEDAYAARVEVQAIPFSKHGSAVTIIKEWSEEVEE